MYTAEKSSQPETFGSIPRVFYFTMVTFATIGYGDVTAITPAGKIIVTSFALIPIILFTIPASSFSFFNFLVIGSGFLEEIEIEKKKKVITFF
jgi:voltage-gated potassium channel